MKSMIVLISILTLFSSCEKEESLPNFLPGSWGLNKTELYVNGSLQGSLEYDEITTIYQFDNCESNTDNTCQLIISEDGENTNYNYIYSQEEGNIMLDSNYIYTVQNITESNLILSQEYGLNKSVWSFKKE